MAGAEVRVEGLRELHSALKRYDAELKAELERELRDAAKLVADNARSRFSAIDSRSAMGFRPRVRGFGRVVVEQRYRRTTGQHPEFGVLQMRRALIPAAYEEEPYVMRATEIMLERIRLESGL